MCWHTNIKLNKLIAKNDIESYKIGYLSLNRPYHFYSYFIPYVYNINKLNIKNNLEISNYKDSSNIYYGFNSYSENLMICDKLGILSIKTDENICIEEYHYTSFELTDKRLAIGKFIIPKGSIYYINENNEFISNKIKYIKGFTFDPDKQKLNSIKNLFENEKYYLMS